MHRVMITGATGYIGSNLTKKLIDQGCDVAIIKRSTSSTESLSRIINKVKMYDYSGEIDSLVEAMKEFKPDIVYHLASKVISRHKAEDIDCLVQSNILFGIHILEAMHISGLNHIVNTSTAWQVPYGNEYNPYSLYTALKQGYEDILKFYSNVYNIKSLSLRLPDTYGPGDDRPKILNLIKKTALMDTELKMSPGEQEIDLLFIDDIVEGFIKAYEVLVRKDEKFNVYALSSCQPIKLKEIVKLYEKLNKKSINIKWGALPYRKNEIMKVEVPENILPGWESKITLEYGLKLLNK